MPEPTVRAARRQRRALADQRRDSNSHVFFDLLTRPELLDTVEALLPEHRERRFPPTRTLSLFLAQAMSDDGSCQRVLNELAVRCIAADTPPPSPSTGSYCQARGRLPLELPRTLCRHVGQALSEAAPRRWSWRDRRVFVADGTRVSMPDSPDNQSRYPQSASQAEGIGFPCARVTGLFCLSTAALLDATVTACKGKGSDEPAALRELLVHVHDNDILLGDAGFESYWVMAALTARGADGVFAAHGGRKLTRGKRFMVLERPERPEWMTPEQHASVPKTIRVRCVEIRHAGETRTLLTTLVDAKGCSAKTLRALYRRRWAAELDFASLKTTLGMDVLRCRSADMVLKEIWVHLLAYNLIRVVMAEAAASASRQPRELSFKHTLQLWSAWQALDQRLDESRTAAMLKLVAGRRVGNRPGRSEPRVTKRRPKPHRLMLRPRLALKIEMYRAGKC